MIYLLLCAIVFWLMSVIGKNRREWLTLAAVTIINFVITVIFDRNGTTLYALVPITTSVGAYVLCKCWSQLGFYHAIILFTTLAAYAALAFDVSQGRHVLIYNNYEAVIYGLVGCQLISVFPTLWVAYRDHIASRGNWLVNRAGVDKA